MNKYPDCVAPMEKIISVFSYLTMGMVGLIWIILAYYLKRRLKYFLMYNITQSMIISIFLAFINLTLTIICAIIAKIKFLDFIMALLNLLMTYKIITFYIPFGGVISFSVFRLVVTLVILYIISGVFLGRIFYVPVLSNLMSKVMKNYN